MADADFIVGVAATPTISLLPEFRPIGAVRNNLVNPSLNPTPGSAEIRVTPANYAPGTTDGLVQGPNPRTISNIVSGGAQALVENPKTSAWQYAFGQFVDHDLGLEQVGDTPIDITVPNGDPKFANGSKIALTRVVTDPATGTTINTLAGFLDLSQLYGSDTATAANLRNADGTLKTSAGDALPIVNGRFVSGDTRVMENPEITAITALFMREHNYWVDRLSAQHPGWTGDQLYNMAKAITTAEYQNIIYTEYLPSVIGNAVGSYKGYDPSVSAQETQEFSAAAFRLGHSEVSDTQTGLDNNGNTTYSQSLFESFFNTPAQDVANDGTNALLRNLSAENAQETDVYAVDGLRNLLVSDPDTMDLIAIDIQRERDLGLGTLNQTRVALGMAPYTSFAQLTSDTTVQAHLRSVYGSIDKVDLFIGGLAENHVAGADVGETFRTIIADQFEALQTGDRYFWLNESFDPATALMISQTTLGDIIERDTNTIVVQQNVFVTAQRHLSNVAADDPTAAQLVIGINDAHAVISGGTGDDTIVAGTGAGQVLTGGGGNDVFVFVGGSHADTITDFNATADQIRFDPPEDDDTPGPGDSLTIMDRNGNAVVQFDDNVITLAGVHASALHSSNFILPAGANFIGQPSLANLFNATYYLNQNLDVVASGMNPLTHYEEYGWKEGRDPGYQFDSAAYLKANPDVAQVGLDPLLHYLDYGAAEGRAAFISQPHGVSPQNPLVDPTYYFSQYGDVADVGLNPLTHYELYGWREWRNPDALFNTKYYLEQNPDVEAAGIDPLLHYEDYGWKEGRNPSASFSTTGYLNANADVRAAGLDPLVHYEVYGMSEGRAVYPV